MRLTQVAAERAMRGDERALRHLYARHSNGACEDIAELTAVRDAIAALPASKREAAFVRHVAGLSHTQVAELADRRRRRRRRADMLAHRKRRHLHAV